ncbi:heme oxygenase [Yoonia maricola]|uniref:Heme oxygenase n=1 Tax=Yoonia maricola TaxID=420999 RepID=A0A2M8W5M0_9RHOB|nr:biliverdin-producing heme oxygenase [Yoonia maricola]PJI86227.1 heme oxygenase [Yoonia maricola]
MQLLEKPYLADTTKLKPPSVRARIAAATRSLHEELHEHPVLGRLMSTDLGEEEYTNILLCHLAFYETAERLRKQLQISTELSLAPELTWLNDDLQGDKDVCPYEGLSLENRSQAIGMLYVLFGSRFGARVIHKNIKIALPTRRHKFFGNALVHDRWSFLLSIIETVSTQKQEYYDVIYGAETTFSAFGAAMLPADAVVNT